MRRNRTGLHRTWFLGLTAALFLAFGPAFAPILSLSPKNNFIEICTAFGAIKMAVAGDVAPMDADHPGHDNSGASGHCLFCNLRQLAMLPPSPPALPLPDGFFVSVFSAPETSFSGQSPFLSYSPRAPPVFS